MASSAPDSRPAFGSLESLRGLFALSVVAMHHPSTLPGEGALFLCVDFFFVLSGFVIAYSYMDRIAQFSDLREYAALRFFRLYPLHITIVGLALAYAFYSGEIRDPTADNAFLAQVLLLTSFPIGEDHIFNPPSWSISAEVVVYIIFGVTLALLRGDKRRFLVVAVIFVLAGVVGCWVVRADAPIEGNMDITLQHGWLRALYGFFLGVLVLAVWRWRKAASHGVRTDTAIELSLAIACVVAFTAAAHYPFSRLIFAAPLLFAVTIYGFAYTRGLLSRALQAPVFSLLGTLSYGIYLVHFPLLPFTTHPALVAWGEQARAAIYPYGEFVTLLELVSYMALVVACAWALHHVVERPARLWSRRRFAPGRVAPGAKAAQAGG